MWLTIKRFRVQIPARDTRWIIVPMNFNSFVKIRKNQPKMRSWEAQVIDERLYARASGLSTPSNECNQFEGGGQPGLTKIRFLLRAITIF